MPPKIKITKAEVIHTAVNIVRKQGEQALNARTVASVLGSSTQPIFSNFETMEELRCAVIEAADALYQEYTRQEIAFQKYPMYKATGMAYIRFAKEEKELFKLLFMRDRSAEVIPAFSGIIADIVKSTTGLNGESSEFFHLEMWAYVHGIATMMATNYLELDTALISQMLTDAYQSMKKHYEGKGL
ncbi:MAG: WHG domain-containing protein [Ruminococcaceae bacterium]|nr:WHG domain-containing protein [Oscillospiraceae bacterium]